MDRNIMKNKRSGSRIGNCSYNSSPIIKRIKTSDDSISNDKLSNECDEEHNNVQSPSIKNTQSESWSEDYEDLSGDLGNYVNETVLSDEAKFRFLELSNIPRKKFVYPYSINLEYGIERRRYLKKIHFEEFKWLVYSEKSGGVFCKYCVLFADCKVSKNKNVIIKSLVTVPLTTYAKILGKKGDLIKHQQNMYHMNAILTTVDFLINFKSSKKGIIKSVDTSRLKEEEDDDCSRLSPILDIEKFVLKGPENISLEGHRDQNQHNESVVKKINVRISAGETILGNHLQVTNSKTTNKSHTSQEQIIDCCKDKIVPNILDKVKVNCYYSILFDETTDVVSHTSQISLILRTIKSENIVDESFISFIDCYDVVNEVVNEDLDKDLQNNEPNSEHDLMEPKLTGELLGNIVVDKLKEFTFDLNNCIGIGTDKCSVMASVMQCAVQQIQKSCKNALHSTFSNRDVNLSIFKSSDVQLVRNNVGTIIDVLSFFNSSPKRNIVLKNSLKNKRRSLTSLCETRWIECHDSIFEFQVNLKNIIMCLESISEWNEQGSSSRAKCLLNAVCNCEFVVTLFALSNILCVTSAASKLLQGVGFDIVEANNCIDNIITTIENKRTNSKIIFNNIFEECKIFMTELDIDIKLPRSIKQQTQRYNTPASCPEEYYRHVLFLPILENAIQNLKVQFLNNKNKTIFILMQLIPINFIKTSLELRNLLIETVMKQYSFLNFNIYSLKGELELWTTKWDDKMCKGLQVPTNVFDAIEECPHVMFPSLRKILFILCTLPVSVATTKPSFSTLPRTNSDKDNKPIFICKLCKQILQNHHEKNGKQLTENPLIFRSTCRFCDRVFETKIGFKYHLKTIHSIISNADIVDEQYNEENGIWFSYNTVVVSQSEPFTMTIRNVHQYH